jgi:hypothetical protein
MNSLQSSFLSPLCNMATPQHNRFVQYRVPPPNPTAPIGFRVTASRNAADVTGYRSVRGMFCDQAHFGQLHLHVIVITAEYNGEGALI